MERTFYFSRSFFVVTLLSFPTMLLGAKKPQGVQQRVHGTSNISITTGGLPFTSVTPTGTLPSTSISKLEAKKKNAQFLDKLTASLLSKYEGSQITFPGNQKKVDEYGQETERFVRFIHWASVGYLFTPEISVSAVANFEIIPVEGKGLSFFDPFPKLKHSRLIHFESEFGTFHHWADLRFYIPVTAKSRESDLFGGVRTTHGGQWDFRSSSFNTGYEFYFRWWWYGPRAKVSTPSLSTSSGDGEEVIEGEQDYEVDASPYVGYRVSPSVELQLSYEMKAGHLLGKDTDDWFSIETALSPGVNWDISKNFSLNSWINLATGGKISPESTSFGFLFTAKY